jgi:hypothetical protein
MYRARDSAEDAHYKQYYEHAHAAYDDRTVAALSGATNTLHDATAYVNQAPPAYGSLPCPGSAWSGYGYSLAPTPNRSYSFTGDTSSEHSSPEILQRSYHSAIAAPNTLQGYDTSPANAASPHGSPNTVATSWGAQNSKAALYAAHAPVGQSEYGTATPAANGVSTGRMCLIILSFT